MARDYYEILGVSKTADDAEIKRAYKKLAKKYHPDVSSEENAEDKFKEASEAFEVLSNSEKRAQYDQFGHDAFTKGGGANPGGFQGGGFGGQGFDFNFDDLFGSFFGGGSSRGRGNANYARGGQDLQIAIELEFTEACFGTSKKIKIKREVNCKKCGGNGAKDGTALETCHTCGGHGVVVTQKNTIFGAMQQQTTCPTCHGEGKIIKEVCDECHGKKRSIEEKTIEINFQAGIDNGDVQRIPGMGNDGIHGGHAGDLYIQIFVKSHEIFKRDDLDILVEMPITITDACLGGELLVPTIHGDVKLKINAGTQQDTIYKLKNKGIISPKEHGDQFVEIKIVVPTKLSKKQKALLEQFRELEHDHRKGGMFDKIKSFLD